MAIALLTATALALVGFVATSAVGFVLAGTHGAAAGPLVTRHVAFAIPTILVSLFSQSMVIFYFIGTGKLVKEETESIPEAERGVIHRALRRFKARTSPPATFSLLLAIAVFVLGGGVHTSALPSWTHLSAAILAAVTHAWAFVAEARVFAENHRLMSDPRRYAREVGAPT
ncbi:MAG TPA: hypothetical protein VKH43_11250 [Thermoanaerobaculia bacterium]|nr:hypothetical protein [Thermoanaerobaculia bacterium]